MITYEQSSNQQGWICPKCGTVWAPWQPCCTICGDNRTTFATGTTVVNPDVSWIPPHVQTTTIEPSSELKLEDVRAILADMSRKGYTAQIRELLLKYGAPKLSGISPANYKALMEDVKGLEHE